jgi:hypothetical protein
MSKIRHITIVAVTLVFGVGLSACYPEKEECWETAIIVDPPERDVIMCEKGAKVSHVQTTQGLIFMCTCPEKEKIP